MPARCHSCADRASLGPDHGTRWAYRKGCRCGCCRCAERAYHDRRARSRLAGERVTWTDCGPARRYLEHLRDCGIGLQRAAQLTGLACSTIQAIRDGQQRRCHPLTEAAILAVRPSLANGQLVSQRDSYRTRDWLRSLLADGFTVGELARLIGRHIVGLQRAQTTPAPRVTVRTWRLVACVRQRYLVDAGMTETDNCNIEAQLYTDS